MDKKLAAIKDALDKETGDGRDIDRAIGLADAYVKANPDKFADYNDLDVHQVAQAADLFRAAGMEERYWLTEVWALHHFELQDIGGPANARVRFIG